MTFAIAYQGGNDKEFTGEYLNNIEQNKAKTEKKIFMKWIILFIVLVALVLLFNHEAYKHKNR